MNEGAAISGPATDHDPVFAASEQFARRLLDYLEHSHATIARGGPTAPGQVHVAGIVLADKVTAGDGSPLDKTLLATVNSDDPAYFEAYVNENYAAVAAPGGLAPEQLTRLARNSFEIAWLPPAERAGYLALIDSYVTAG